VAVIPGETTARSAGVLPTVYREIRICHEFIKYDYATGFIPPVLFVIMVADYYQLPMATFISVVAKGLLIFLGYIYAFCLSNQLAGVLEDRINKPSRPLPTALLTTDQAWSRLVFVLVGYASLGLWFGVAWWVLLWQGVLLLHNQGRWSTHWTGKNVIMGVGTLAQLAAAWSLVAPISGVGWQWILTMSIVIFTLIPLQDLRDIDGDRAEGRRTFPVAFGSRLTRGYVAVGFGVLPWVIHTQLMSTGRSSHWVTAVDLILGGWAWVIAWRVLYRRTPRADHWSYTLWTFWYCATLASLIIVLS
jgi:4-hydroxybenzoate polyprenyltransferase